MITELMGINKLAGFAGSENLTGFESKSLLQEHLDWAQV